MTFPNDAPNPGKGPGVGHVVSANYATGDYHTIYANVSNILSSYWGQSLNCTDRGAGSVISALDWHNLRTDILRGYWHIYGTDYSSSFRDVYPQPTAPTAGYLISDSDRSALYNASVNIVNNVYSAPASGQATRTTIASVSNGGGWNSLIQQTITINFGSAAAANHFFNAGGRFEISASISGYPSSGASTAKDATWNTMLTSMGIIYFLVNNTTFTTSGSDPLGTAASLGWNNMTTSPQAIFYQAAPSGAYTANDYYIYAYKSSDSSTLYFNIQFQDNATTANTTVYGGIVYGIDETVDGTITSKCEAYYATGPYISVPLPGFSSTGLSGS